MNSRQRRKELKAKYPNWREEETVLLVRAKLVYQYLGQYTKRFVDRWFNHKPHVRIGMLHWLRTEIEYAEAKARNP